MLDESQRQQVVSALLELVRSPQSVTIDGTSIQYRSIRDLLELLRETSEPVAVVVKLRAPGAQS